MDTAWRRAGSQIWFMLWRDACRIYRARRVEGVVLRRSTKIAAVLAAATLALAGCAKDNKTSSTGTSGNKPLDCSSTSGDGPKVGLAYDVGGQGDQSFNDSAAAGLKKAVADMSATCTEGEAQDGEPESAREDRLRQMADAGDNPVIAVGFAYSDVDRRSGAGLPRYQLCGDRRLRPDPRTRPTTTSPTSASPRTRAPSSSVSQPLRTPRPTRSASSAVSTST